jgi:hypothetical protein
MYQKQKTRKALVLSALACAAARMLAAQTPAHGCQALYDASDKLYTVPNHMFLTETAQFRKNGPLTGETIFTGQVRYVLIRGHWIKSPITSEDGLKQAIENRKTAQNISCQFLRDDLVNAEPASVYHEHFEVEDAKKDGQIWLSKRTGLLLRLEQDTDVGGAMGKSHSSIRYEYKDIRPPADVH